MSVSIFLLSLSFGALEDTTKMSTKKIQVDSEGRGELIANALRLLDELDDDLKEDEKPDICSLRDSVTQIKRVVWQLVATMIGGR